MREIEMDLPDPTTPSPTVSAMAQEAAQALMSAPTVDMLAKLIVPLRAWPEGPDKDHVRRALRAREAQLRGKPAQPAQEKPVFSLAALQTTWRALFGSLARTIQADSRLAARPVLRVNGVVPVTQEQVSGAYARPAAPDFAARAVAAVDRAVAARRTDPALAMPREGYPDTSSPVQPKSADGGSPTVTTEAPIQSRPEVEIREAMGGINLQANTRRGVTTLAPAAPAAVSVPEMDARDTRAAVRARDVIVGAREAGSGVMLGWGGLGEATRVEIIGWLADVGLPESWAPTAKSDHFHASAALMTLAQSGRVVRTERGRQRVQRPDGAYRAYVARWTVGNPLHGQVGDRFGLTVLTAALTSTGVLDLDGDPELCARVREEYARRQAGGGVYPAGEVTDWLRDLLVYRFAAVRLGGGWYVPQGHAEIAERLCERVARGWGRDWILPALPIATTDQLRAGLVRGLAKEADAVLKELEDQRKAARKDRPGGDITADAAQTLLGKLQTVYERAKGYSLILGGAFTAEIRTKLEDAVSVVSAVCGPAGVRFALMDLK